MGIPSEPSEQGGDFPEGMRQLA